MRLPTSFSLNKRRATTKRRPEPKGVQWWVVNGDIFVSAIFQGDELSCVRIEFHKETSRIPSLKNSKIPGRNFLNPDTLDRLKAMDALYNRSTRVYHPKGLSFGKRAVVGLLVCNKRPTRFDLDNCVAAVKDWCEPSSKRGRGWGVGLVEDDSKLNVIAVHAADLGLSLDHSVLVLKEWSSMASRFSKLMSNLFLT